MSSTDLTQPSGSKSVADLEIRTMTIIQRQLKKLDPKAQRRVLEFFSERLRSHKEGQ